MSLALSKLGRSPSRQLPNRKSWIPKLQSRKGNLNFFDRIFAATRLVFSKKKVFMRLRAIAILLSLVVFVGFLGYQFELTIPGRPPSISSTYTPFTKPAPQEIGSYDVLGEVVSQAQADRILQTEAGRKQLLPENGAVEINQNRSI